MIPFIDYIDIANFKSLQHCEISGCKRINLFIGRPNVGKSNILEALSLFSIPFLRDTTSKKLSSLIRLENERELFYNGNTEDNAVVKTNIGHCGLRYSSKEGLRAIVDYYGGDSYDNIQIDEKLSVRGLKRINSFEPVIKRYNFKSDIVYRKGHARFLAPPYGYNLLSIIENYADLREDVKALFKEYGLKIALDKASQTIKILQDEKDDIYFFVPYNSIADTLQRIIFYKAAISSNDNSILLFEEPEAHSFPPYMTHITQEMIYKKSNQYFVATHSPFILNDLLENGRDELSVFVVFYENYETKVKKLSDKELHDVFQDGIDLFTNSESYI